MQPESIFERHARKEKKAKRIRRFLDENPHVYLAFEREALRMWNRGWRHYSARTIIEYLRHQSHLKADPSGLFKVNNDLGATLARDFLARHPEVGDKYFELRYAKVEPSFTLEG